jgi:hypothetical protein
MQDLTTDPRYKEARNRARRLRGFYVHALVFVLVNLGFFAVNFLTTPGKWWFGWPTLGWGIGLMAHGLSVAAVPGLFGADWEERKIREYLEKRG